jgi:hypothetical protein
MKVLNLTCATDHAFEGWFASLEEFERQCSERLLRCPICDDVEVRRLPAAPRLSLGAPSERDAEGSLATRALLDKFQTMLASTEDVGSRFAEEARRIHYLETKARNIRGTVSVEERHELAEEGIEILTLPIPVAPKKSLQ